MVKRNTPDSHRIVIDCYIDLSTPQGLTIFKSLLDEFRVFDEGKNREVFVNILNSIDPNNEYGLHAICDVYLSDPNNQLFTNVEVQRLLQLYANQLDLSKLDILQSQKYAIDLSRSGLLSVQSAYAQFLDAIRRIDAAGIIAIGEKKSRSNGRNKAIGYKQIINFLEAIDAFELNPQLLSEMIDIYSNIGDWENYYEGEFLVQLKQTIKDHPEIIGHIKQSLEVLVQRTIDQIDCLNTYLLITSGLFNDNPILFGRLYYSLVDKAKPETGTACINQGQENAISFLGSLNFFLGFNGIDVPERPISHTLPPSSWN